MSALLSARPSGSQHGGCRLSPRLWLIEGIPGSGKTTAAAQLTTLCTAKDMPARWWLEEAKDHPVLPADLRRRSAEAGFATLCIEAFRAFVRAETGILILEGSAFQNTVRFMYANNWPRSAIEGYLTAWSEVVAPAEPRLLLFHVRDPRTHYLRFVQAQRGDAWTDKLVAYVERTPIAKVRGWTGLNGFIQFWAEYQDLCLGLAEKLPLPTLILETWSERLSFDLDAAFAHLAE